MRGSGIGWVLWLLAVAGRLQAIEARRISMSQRLAAVGLTAGVDLAVAAPAALAQRPEALVLGATPVPSRRAVWAASEISACVEALNARSSTRAVSIGEEIALAYARRANEAAAEPSPATDPGAH